MKGSHNFDFDNCHLGLKKSVNLIPYAKCFFRQVTPHLSGRWIFYGTVAAGEPVDLTVRNLQSTPAAAVFFAPGFTPGGWPHGWFLRQNDARPAGRLLYGCRLVASVGIRSPYTLDGIRLF